MHRFFPNSGAGLLRRQACAAAAEKLAGELPAALAAALELSVAAGQPRCAHRGGWRMSLSLHSDSENSSSSDQHGPVFGSARVLPDSPTPYTDATQVCKPAHKLHASSHVRPFLSASAPETSESQCGERQERLSICKVCKIIGNNPCLEEFDILVLWFLCCLHTLKMVQLASYEYPCCISSTKCLGPVGRIV